MYRRRRVKIKYFKRPISTQTVSRIKRASTIEGVHPIIHVDENKIVYEDYFSVSYLELNHRPRRIDTAVSILKQIEDILHRLHKIGLAPGAIDLYTLVAVEGPDDSIIARLLIDERILDCEPNRDVTQDEFEIASIFIDFFPAFYHKSMKKILYSGLGILQMINRAIVGYSLHISK